MSIYIGLIVLDAIKNRSRFHETINEIKHFIHTYQEEIFFEISKSLITIKPKFGGTEACFTTNCNYFHTNFFRISGESKLSEDLKQFAYVIWECCCIFKENFPSKIELFQENLDLISNITRCFSGEEILRRQISTLNSKKISNDPVKIDEVEDVLCILEAAWKKKNLKGVTVSLGILASAQLCPLAYLHNMPEKYCKIVESMISGNEWHEYELDDEKAYKEVETNKMLASNLLMRIIESNSKSSQIEKIGHSSSQKDSGTDPSFVIYEKPNSIKTCLFQLNESNDINRIVFLIDHILNVQFNKDLKSNTQIFFQVFKWRFWI